MIRIVLFNLQKISLKFCTAIFLFNCFSTANSQSFRGIVLDKVTGDKISYASVYFNGTTTGTTCDINGSFELNVSRIKNIPVTISALGYYSATYDQFPTESILTIYLAPKDYELNEVLVTAKSKHKNKSYLKLFKEQFLGKTPNALECEIVNENEIIFEYDFSSDKLIAKAMKPILINNKALAYHITYYLDNFEHCETQTTTFKGNCLFTDDLNSLNDSIKKIVLENRKQTYLGSKMHFFRSVGENKLDSDGFVVRGPNFSKLMYPDLVLHKRNLKEQNNQIVISHDQYIRGPGILNIWYSRKRQKSGIDIRRDLVPFNKNGYFEPIDIYFTGEMALQRMSDELPYDYNPE